MEATISINSERACPVCECNLYVHFADERIDTIKINDFTYASRKPPEFMCLRLVKCVQCDLVYAPTPPSADFLFDAYSKASYDSDLEAQAAANSYAAALMPHIQSLVERNAAVDVGAGSGPLLPWLQKNGFYPVIGIEPSRAAIEAAPLGVKPMLREGMFSRLLLADVKPSLLCSFMTLEHMTNPREFISTVFDLLEPGGMLAVVVHDWRAPLNRLLGLRSPIIDVEHLQLFSPQSLRVLLAQGGFTSIKIQSIQNTYPLRYWLRLTPLPISVKKRVTTMFDVVGFSNKQISVRVGNILAVAIKPMQEG